LKISVEQTIARAKFSLKKGDIAAAKELYENVLQAFPHNKRAKQGLADLIKNQKKLSQSFVKTDLESLGQLYNKGHFSSVIQKANSIIQNSPKEASIWEFLGAAHRGLGNTKKALAAFKTVVELNPYYAQGYNNLGVALQDKGENEEAIECFLKALSLKSKYAEAHNNLGNSFKDQGDLDKAIEAFEKAISCKPNYSAAYNNLGSALHNNGDLDDAFSALNKALSINPKNFSAYNNLGLLYKDIGKVEDASKAFKKAIFLNNGYISSHRNLSALVKYQAGDPQIDIVDGLLSKSDLNEHDRSRLLYVSAKIREDLGDYKRAFDCYVAGGNLRKKNLSYELIQDQRLFSQIKTSSFKLKKYRLNIPKKDVSTVPIFILGMPRSGTSLVEQILSSHSQIHGAGELPFLARFGESFSCGFSELSQEALLGIRNDYLTKLSNLSSDKKFITDKMPHNFLHVGLILKILPEAKIIHVKRDPAATCWSNFKTYFSTRNLGYSYNLNDIVAYFKLYLDLMNHWDKYFGPLIYSLDYDKLTRDTKVESKKVVNYLNINWENACLEPHKNMRSVRTASQQQVRKKIYTGSSEAWREFLPYLKNIFDDFQSL
tara:strand:+ start:70 stop:1875 length:1806 start_codon:yes stop_codon:yes gene_type:complete